MVFISIRIMNVRGLLSYNMRNINRINRRLHICNEDQLLDSFLHNYRNKC
jgi:hypothetical protein